MTAKLQILKGPQGVSLGSFVPLTTGKMIFGRNPDCHIVIPASSVSRDHAHIVFVNGKYYIEDQGSRNGTHINEVRLPEKSRRELKDNDCIKICDFEARFTEAESARKPLPKELLRDSDPENEEEHGSTTVEATMMHNSSILLDRHPTEKINALLEISTSLNKTLKLDELLPKIADSLFVLFKQADRCFIILVEDGSARLMPKVVKTRRQQDEANARFSKTIIRKCVDQKTLVLSNNAEGDRALMSQSVVDFRIRSVMCVPMVSSTTGKVLGVIQLDTQDRSKKFTQDDLNLLLGVSNQSTIALENARLHEEAKVAATIAHDLELASKVQRLFLPAHLPEVPGYEFFAYYEPAKMVGGDYYGFVPLGLGRMAISLGDVAGKGAAAALLMAKLSSDVRYCLISEPDVTRAIALLNEQVYRSAGQLDRFVTLASAVLDTARGEITLVNAGQETPLLYRGSTGEVVEAHVKEKGGLPMGVMDGQTYEAMTVSLAPGDTLVMFSDGVSDAMNIRDEKFKPPRIISALKTDGPRTPRSLGERVIKAVKQHAGTREQNDDITLVCVGRLQ
jgi:serine phosphatase RsbU (regulator of sigma subunit)